MPKRKNKKHGVDLYVHKGPGDHGSMPDVPIYRCHAENPQTEPDFSPLVSDGDPTEWEVLSNLDDEAREVRRRTLANEAALLRSLDQGQRRLSTLDRKR